MIVSKTVLAVVAALALGGTGVAIQQGVFSSKSAAETLAGTIAVTITSTNGAHVFQVEQAKTASAQERGLMYRTDLADSNGMLFWPYPPTGEPRVASFWMKNTPTSLDIVFIRADGTIATIAENTVPQDETPVSSGEPVGAVLEVKGGRTAALGIAAGDKVSWAK